jgi:hypothetical protein
MTTSFSRTLMAVFSTLIIGTATFFATLLKPEIKNKRVELSRKKTMLHNSENLFI